MPLAGAKRGIPKSREPQRLQPWDGSKYTHVNDFAVLCGCGTKFVMEPVADRGGRTDLPKQALYCHHCAAVVPWLDAWTTLNRLAQELQAQAVKLVPFSALTAATSKPEEPATATTEPLTTANPGV
jgi:hypothetical protein